MATLLITVWAQSLFIETVTSQTVSTYQPSEYNLLDRTAFVSGALTDLQSDDDIYMTFRSYASQTSEQTLYAHQETTTIAGTSYNLSKLESADMTGMNLSVSMASTGRQLWGKFVYQLAGVPSIPASTWTVYYRTWHSGVPEDVSTSSPSSIPLGIWNNPTFAYSSDDAYAYTSTDLAIQAYGNYGFNIPATASVTKVEVGYEAFTETDEKIGITCSWDGGTNWATEYQSPILGTTDPDTVTWVDFTVATSWTPDKLSDANFLTRVKGIRIGSGSMDNVYLDWIPVRVTYIVPSSAHAEIDILVRKSDGTVRETIATKVANSETLSSNAQTLFGTYSWPEYTVLDATDYLEVDYYLNVTVAKSGVTAYLRIDDSSLDIADQTRVSGVILPSEYVAEVEFAGSSNTDYWSQLVWTVDSAWTTDSVSVILQLYNYELGAYPTSGDGYIEYTSSAGSNTDETKSQIITTNPTNFRSASGNWKIKIKGVKSTTSQFDFKVDLIRFETTSRAPPDVAVLNITLSSTSVYSGEIVTINVTVKNEGGTTETFNVTLHYDDTPIGKQTVSSLAPAANTTLTFYWNTTEVTPDTYTIKAVADTVPDETDTADNTFTDDTVKVLVPGAPLATFTYSPIAPVAGDAVTFNASSSFDPDGTITSYAWDFGDGSLGSGTIVTHTYEAAGSYNVTLTITDDEGLKDTATSLLTVFVHDIAILSVTPTSTDVYAGHVVDISVVVKNEGNANETFHVATYYDGTLVGRQTVTDLAPGEERTLYFSWSTSGVTSSVSYRIKAEATVLSGETDTTDNIYVDGEVRVSPKPTSSLTIPFPYFIPIILTLVGCSVIWITWKKQRQAFIGFDFFHEISGGGIPEASSVMIMGGPSSGKSVLSQQLAFNHLENGKTCVYISYDCFPDEVRQNMKNFLWDISMYEKEGSFCFIDCYSQIAGVKSKERYSIDQPFSLSDLGIMISEAMGSVGQKSPMVILDSTVPLFARIDSAKVLEFIQDRSARIKGENGIFLFIVGKGTVSAGHMNKLKEIVDCIIELQAIEEKGKIARRLRIKKLRGRNFVDAWIPFRIESKSGITFLAKKRK